MARITYVFRNGRFVELGKEGQAKDPVAPAVIGDEMDPIKHPVTEEIIDSKSKYHRVNKSLGLEVVGNDLLSQRPQHLKEKITDEVILDRIEKAEAILSDPSKMRAREHENHERLERAEKLMYGNRR
jgi:hypothetical protein